MATKKKTTRSLGNLDDRETKVLDAYNKLSDQTKRVPNNHEISKETKLNVNTVGLVRRALVKLKIMLPSPKGKTKAIAVDAPKEKPIKNAIRFVDMRKSKRKRPTTSDLLRPLAKTQMEHQMLPDDSMQSAAMVLALPAGPLADAAAAIREQLVKLEASRSRLMAALTALGET